MNRKGGWRRLNNVRLHNSYASLYIITVTKSRTMRWAGHVASMEEMRNYTKFWSKTEKKENIPKT
jgi:hypothetical protein